MTTMTPTPAWQFVIDHHLAICRWAHHHCPNNTEVEDFRQELTLNVHASVDRYDAKRASGATWIMYQSLALRKSMIRRDRNQRTLRAKLKGQRGIRSRDRSANRIECQAQLSRVLEFASAKNIEAMQTKLEDLTKDEVKHQLGISYQARDGQLRRLGARVIRAA